MIKSTLIATATSAVFIITSPAFAQAPQNPGPMHKQQMHQQMHQQGNMPRPMMQGWVRPNMTAPGGQHYPGYPTPEQLARMAPPESTMTQESIKKHFAKRKAMMTESVERDRKDAEKYAQDFARMQKFQADRLAKMMANAEKQREAMLKRIDAQEKHMLEKFNKQQNTSK